LLSDIPVTGERAKLVYGSQRAGVPCQKALPPGSRGRARATNARRNSRVAFLVGFLPALLIGSAGGATVTLAWNRNPEPDIAGYRLYYGTAAEPFNTVIDVRTTTATASDLLVGLTYTFAVTAYNTAGVESAFSKPVSYTPGASRVIPSAILFDVSTRAFVQIGENVLIGGFILEGVLAKTVALRAIGPSLATGGLQGALADPVLVLADSTGSVVASNDNWNIPSEEISGLGLAPTDAREAALVTTLAPGAYSAVITGSGSTTGIALFELYDVDLAKGRVANISTRSRVEPGDDAMFGGFILGGTTSAKIIVRAIGPSLVTSGIADFLPDPTLEIYDANGASLGANDDWRTDQEEEIIDSQLPPADDREAAIVLTLSPGGYTAVVRGSNDSTGVALFEVYALNE